MSVSLPTGLVPVAEVAGIAALTGSRSARYRYEILDRYMNLRGPLDGVQGSSLTESAASSLKRGGNMAVTDRGQDINWLTDRVKVTYEVDGYGEWGCGAYVPSMPDEAWRDGGRRWDVQMLDVATVLAEDRLAATYSLDAGTNIVDAVRTLITDGGESAGAITDSDLTLPTPRAWEAGSTRLEIINDLKDIANYFALFSDGDGQLRFEPYVRPAVRPVKWEFIDGETCIYRPDLSRKRDLYAVPNRVIVKGRGTGDDEGLVAVADNTNPDSDFSITTLGRVKAAEPYEVDAADQATLDAIAQRRLIEATTPTSTIVIQALPVPVSTNDAVRFRREPMGIDSRHVVTRIELPASPTGLATYTLREVVDV